MLTTTSETVEAHKPEGGAHLRRHPWNWKHSSPYLCTWCDSDTRGSAYTGSSQNRFFTIKQSIKVTNGIDSSDTGKKESCPLEGETSFKQTVSLCWDDGEPVEMSWCFLSLIFRAQASTILTSHNRLQVLSLCPGLRWAFTSLFYQ